MSSLLMRKYIDLLNEGFTCDIAGKTFYFDEEETEPSTIKTIAVKEKTRGSDDLIRHYGTLTYSDGKLSLLYGGDEERPKILPTPQNNKIKSIMTKFKEWYKASENL